jgi:hypothetical protein
LPITREEIKLAVLTLANQITMEQGQQTLAAQMMMMVPNFGAGGGMPQLGQQI